MNWRNTLIACLAMGQKNSREPQHPRYPMTWRDALIVSCATVPGELSHCLKTMPGEPMIVARIAIGVSKI